MDATDGVKTPEKMASENSNMQETPQTMPQPESSLQLLETQPAKESFRFTFASPIRVQFTERRSILHGDPMHVDGSVSLNLAEDIALPPIFQNKNKELQQPETVCLVPEANRPQVKKNNLQRNDDQTQEKEENESKDLHIKHVQPDMDVQTVNDEQLVSSFANGNLKIAVEALISLSSSPNTVQAQEVSTAQGDMQERSGQEKTEGEDLHEQPDVQTVDIIDLAKESLPGASEAEDLYVMGVQPALDCQTVIVEETDSGCVNNELNFLASSPSSEQPQKLEPASSNKQKRSEQEQTEGKDLHEQPDLNVQTVDFQKSFEASTNDNVELSKEGLNSLASSPSAVQPQESPPARGDMQERSDQKETEGKDLHEQPDFNDQFLNVEMPDSGDKDFLDLAKEQFYLESSPDSSECQDLYVMGVQPALDCQTDIVEITDSGSYKNELNSLASSSSAVQPQGQQEVASDMQERSEQKETEGKDLHEQPDLNVQTVDFQKSFEASTNDNVELSKEGLNSLASSPSAVQPQESPPARGDMQERSDQKETEGKDLHEQPDFNDQFLNVEMPDSGDKDFLDLAKEQFYLESSPDSSECQDLYVMGVQPALDCQTDIVEITDSGSYNNELNSLASSSSAVQPQGQQEVASDMQERSEQKETEGKDLHEQPDFNVQNVDVEKSGEDSSNDNVELASSSTAVQITDLERRWNEGNVGEDFLIVAWPGDSIDRELEQLSQLSPMRSEEEELYMMGVQPALDVSTVIVEVTDSGNVNNGLNSLASSSSDVQPEELLLPSNNDIGKNTTGQPTKKWIMDIMSYVGVAPERRYTISAVNETSTASMKRRHHSSNPSEDHQKAYESFIKDLTALLKKRTLRSCNISSYKQIIPTIPKRVKARQSGTVAPRRSKRLVENIQEEVESTEEAARPPKRRRQNEVMEQDSPPTTSRNLRSSTTNTAEVSKKPGRPKKKTAQVPKKPGRPEKKPVQVPEKPRRAKKKPAQVPKKPGRPKKNK